jgi:small subunit ribosomal protein S2
MSEQQQMSEHRASIEDLLKAGTHFGHLTSRWNPKMKSFIFMKRNGIHILNLNMTQEYLDRAADAATRYAKRGKPILFAGTKKQAQDIIRKHAKASGSPYVVERWLGGTLTNFSTIRKSIRRMEELVKMEAEGTLVELKKKERLMKAREREKLEKILSGIQDMARLPGAIFVVDIKREHIAIQEAKKLNIPVIAIDDTNCDPDLVDYPIPANDDAFKSIDLITGIISEAIIEGQKARDEQETLAKQERDQKQAETDEVTRKKRSRKPAEVVPVSAKAGKEGKAAAEAKPAAAAKSAPASESDAGSSEEASEKEAAPAASPAPAATEPVTEDVTAS